MNYPKIGFPPIIDERLAGVREYLEAATMQMAKNVAAFFAKELCYPDGKAGSFFNFTCLFCIYRMVCILW